jgi:hypothetical protein
MQILAIRHNTTNNITTDFTGQAYREIRSVNGDTVLIAAQFNQQDLNGVEIPVDLSGVLALRSIVGLDRQEGTTVLAFQDSYNTGQVPSNEDLVNGRVTWLLSLSDPQIIVELDTNEFIDVILEFTILTADNLPQTLGQIAYRIYAQVDNGAVGTPPPYTPDYYTALEIDGLIAGCLSPADYISPLYIAVDSVLTAINGIQYIYVDTSGGPINITLPEASAAPAKWSPIIVNTGTNDINIIPSGGNLINGTAGTLIVATQYAAAQLFSDQVNARYLAPLIVVP